MPPGHRRTPPAQPPSPLRTPRCARGALSHRENDYARAARASLAFAAPRRPGAAVLLCAGPMPPRQPSVESLRILLVGGIDPYLTTGARFAAFRELGIATEGVDIRPYLERG